MKYMFQNIFWLINEITSFRAYNCFLHALSFHWFNIPMDFNEYFFQKQCHCQTIPKCWHVTRYVSFVLYESWVSLCSTLGPQSGEPSFVIRQYGKLNTAGLFRLKNLNVYRILLFTHKIKTLLGYICFCLFSVPYRGLGGLFQQKPQIFL